MLDSNDTINNDTSYQSSTTVNNQQSGGTVPDIYMALIDMYN